MDNHATGRAPACCKAGPISNLGLAPQGGSPTEPTEMKKLYIPKPKKSQEEKKFLRQKIKESEDKVDDLKSDAKRQKIISHNYIQ